MRATVSAGRTADSSRRGHLEQQRVAGVVAERVVDELEAVDVEEEDGDGAGAAAHAAAQREREAVLEQRAVRQAGQRVVHRAVQQVVLVRLARGHVARHRDQLLAGAREARLDPHDLAVVGAPHPEARERLPVAPRLACGLDQRGRVVGQHVRQPGLADQRLAGAAEQAPRRRRGVLVRAVRRVPRDQVSRVIDHAREHPRCARRLSRPYISSAHLPAVLARTTRRRLVAVRPPGPLARMGAARPRGMGPGRRGGPRGRSWPVRLLGAIPVPARILAKAPGHPWTWRVGPVEMAHRVEPRPGGAARSRSTWPRLRRSSARWPPPTARSSCCCCATSRA